nr:hypothetical protein [Tanacetum cinerariifolium]
MLKGLDKKIERKEDGGIYLAGRIWVPGYGNLKTLIMNEAHATRKGVVSFGKRSKLSPRYVGPYEIVERVGPVAYRLRLPRELVGVHDTFHVSNLKNCLTDANLHVPLEEVKIDDKLHFVEEPMEIMDHEVKKLKKRRIPIIKALGMSRDVLTIDSTMRTPLLYRGEYSQWVERFMDYLEEQTDGEAMVNSIKNGDQPLPRVTQISISRTTSIEQPPLKDKSMWSDQEKRVQRLIKKNVVITSDPLALITEKTNVSKSKEKVVVFSNSEGSEADDF